MDTPSILSTLSLWIALAIVVAAVLLDWRIFGGQEAVKRVIGVVATAATVFLGFYTAFLTDREKGKAAERQAELHLAILISHQIQGDIAYVYDENSIFLALKSEKPGAEARTPEEIATAIERLNNVALPNLNISDRLFSSPNVLEQIPESFLNYVRSDEDSLATYKLL